MTPGEQAAAVERLSNEIRELAAHIAAAEYRWLKLLAEFDRLRGWAHEGCKSGVQWLSWACGLSPMAARERLRVARALDDLPLISRGFSLGELSYSKVRALTRIATAENEELLATWGKWATAAQLEKIVRGYRSARRTEDLVETHARYQDRYVHYFHDDDGCLVVQARLPAEDGALLVKALQQAAETLGEERPDGPSGNENGSSTNGSEGLGELPEVAAYTSDVGDIWAARRADGLRIMAETMLAAGPRAVSSKDHYQVVVHVDAEVLSEAAADGRCRLADGPALVPETLRRLVCDSTLVPLVEASGGEIIGTRRKRPSIPAAVRRALRARDGGCRFPSCTAVRFCDAHHVVHLADGGETTLANLVLLCPFHHRLIHEGGYTMRVDGPGRFTFFRPCGEEIPSVPPPMSGSADQVIAATDGLGIDGQTPVAEPYEPRPNYHDAVAGLLAVTDGRGGYAIPHELVPA